MFTNGSTVDFNLLEKYNHHITLVFSLDAIGKPSEYIRYGSSWETVKQNYLKAKTYSNIETRVNITLSPYNYWYLPALIDFLLEDWPAVVTFGRADVSSNSKYMDESIIPTQFRNKLIDELNQSLKKILKSSVEINQKLHAVQNIRNITINLKELPWNETEYLKFKEFIRKMDSVKMISITDYCKSTADMVGL
jgi:sulfatase maturation enzyme AslB (radical SAM superfamily)